MLSGKLRLRVAFITEHLLMWYHQCQVISLFSLKPQSLHEVLALLIRGFVLYTQVSKFEVFEK